jgi:hypothetical protein
MKMATCLDLHIHMPADGMGTTPLSMVVILLKAHVLIPGFHPAEEQ